MSKDLKLSIEDCFVLKHAPLGVLYYDREGIVRDCNDKMVELLGSSREKIIGLCLLRLKNRGVVQAVQKSLGGERAVYFGEYVSETGGKRLFLRSVFEPVFDGNDFKTGIVMTEDFTKEEELRKSLEKERENLKLAQRVANIGSWYLDIPSGRLEWSEQSFRIFEMSPQEITLDLFLAKIHPEDFNRVVKTWKEALNGAPYDIEHRIVTEKGNVKWVRERANVRLDEQGKAVFEIGTIQDISDFKEMERKLQESLLYQETLLGAIPDIVMQVDENKVYVYANRAGLWFFGDDVIGKEASFYFEGEQETYEIVEPLFEGSKELIYVESWQRRRDGHKRLLAWWCRTLYDAEGRIIGTLSSARDITDERRNQEELLKSRMEYQNLAEHSPLGIVRVNREGEILYLNPKAKEIFRNFPGEEKEEKEMKRLITLLLLKQGSKEKIERCLKEERYFVEESHYILSQDKDLWVRVHMTPIRIDHRFEEVQVVFEDISVRKEMELLKEREERKLRLILDGIPNPAWLITRERKIVFQNQAAQKFGTTVGGSCWDEIFKGEFLPEKYKEQWLKTKQAEGAHCSFCQAETSLAEKKVLSLEIDFKERAWEIWWVPIEEDLFLHYMVDVTKFKRMQEKFRRQAMIDPLTGLYNRRYFVKQVEMEILRSKRTKSKLSLIMMDIDHFKEINDIFGHNVGDEVLKKVAQIIQDRIRQIDIAARWGGEEFVILLPETSVKGGAVLAESLRKRIEAAEFHALGHITASFGVSAYHEGDGVDLFVDRADKLMYAAKKSGRNTVRIEQE